MSEIVNIEELIPHRGRLKLVDEVFEDSEGRVWARSVTTPKWPLCDAQGKIDVIVLIEFAAQASAVIAGYEKRKDGEPGVSGMLVGIRRAVFHIPELDCGVVLTAACRKLRSHENYFAYEGKVYSDGRLIAEVEIQALETPGGGIPS